MRFSILRLLALTAFLGGVFAFVIGISEPYHNEGGAVLAVLTLITTLYFSALILLGRRKHWFRYGNAAGFSLLGALLGFLLFRSPLPGAFAGLLAACALIFLCARDSDPLRRKRAVAWWAVALFCVLAISLAMTWRHHRAKFKIWEAGGRLSWGAKSLRLGIFDLDQPQTQMLGNFIGPYLIPGRTSVDFDDDPVRWGGLRYSDEDLIRLRPHLEAIHGLDSITIRCKDVGDDGASQLANITGLERVSFIETQISSKGIENLRHLSDLVWLDVTGSQVDDDMIQKLESFPSLRFLSMSGTQITDEGLRELSKLKLPLLYQVDAPTHISQDAIDELRKSIRNVRQW